MVVVTRGPDGPEARLAGARPGGLAGTPGASRAGSAGHAAFAGKVIRKYPSTGGTSRRDGPGMGAGTQWRSSRAMPGEDASKGSTAAESRKIKHEAQCRDVQSAVLCAQRAHDSPAA